MIARDGTCTSLWQHMPTYVAKNSIDLNFEYDVAIVGGGITGITTAFRLQQAGKKCVLLESNTLGFGTTGGTTAHLNTLMDTPYSDIIKKFNKHAVMYVKEAAEDAIYFIKSRVNELRIDCGFEYTSAFLFARDDDQQSQLQDVVKGCNSVNLATRLSDTIPVPILFKQAIEVPGQAKFHPLRYSYALAEKFEANGGIIVQNARVRSHHENNGSVALETDNFNIQTKAVIYATHIPPGINLMHLRCAPWRSYAMAVTLNDERQYPTGLAYDLYDPYHYYRTQQIDGKNYLIVGGEDHKTGQSDNTDQSFLHLESHIRSYFDVNEIVDRWSSQYFESSDGLPYIGHVPGTLKNTYVATGFGGNGMIYGTVAARVLQNILTNVDDELIKLFSPSRIKPIAGFTSFFEHNTDVVKELLSDLLPTPKLEVLVDLAPGDGKIVKFENKTLAVSKDRSGIVHAVQPLCTHMKCTVQWNISEQSWDCPCHGARFSAEGKVLTGPASKDLASVLSSGVETIYNLSSNKQE